MRFAFTKMPFLLPMSSIVVAMPRVLIFACTRLMKWLEIRMSLVLPRPIVISLFESGNVIFSPPTEPMSLGAVSFAGRPLPSSERKLSSGSNSTGSASTVDAGVTVGTAASSAARTLLLDSMRRSSSARLAPRLLMRCTLRCSKSTPVRLTSSSALRPVASCDC